jgi:uncharacterized protein YutE (UPF0331/DUF86 family)
VDFRFREHRLLEAMSAVVDRDLVTRRRLAAPETAAGMFDTLRDATLIEPALATSLSRMARFRNLLVHDYVKVDASKVFDIAANDVKDMEIFSGVVAGLI